jgi:hypothetical protein
MIFFNDHSVHKYTNTQMQSKIWSLQWNQTTEEQTAADQGTRNSASDSKQP